MKVKFLIDNFSLPSFFVSRFYLNFYNSRTDKTSRYLLYVAKEEYENKWHTVFENRFQPTMTIRHRNYLRFFLKWKNKYIVTHVNGIEKLMTPSEIGWHSLRKRKQKSSTKKKKKKERNRGLVSENKFNKYTRVSYTCHKCIGSQRVYIRPNFFRVKR